MNYFSYNLTLKSVNNSDSIQTQPCIFCSYWIYTFCHYLVNHCRLFFKKKNHTGTPTVSVLYCHFPGKLPLFFFKMNNKCPYSKDT